MFSLTSSVVQKTQTALPVTTSYPASQFALTGSSKVTGPAPLEDEPSELDVGDEGMRVAARLNVMLLK